jgi:hypothetical protein
VVVVYARITLGILVVSGVLAALVGGRAIPPPVVQTTTGAASNDIDENNEESKKEDEDVSHATIMSSAPRPLGKANVASAKENLEESSHQSSSSSRDSEKKETVIVAKKDQGDVVVPQVPVDAPRVYGNPGIVINAVVLDAIGLPKSIAYSTRYLSLHNIPLDYRAEFLRALNIQINRTSRNAEIIPVRPVLPDASVVALNIDDYRWDRAVFGATADTDQYWHTHKVVKGVIESTFRLEMFFEKQAVLAKAVDSRSPIIQADWFLVQISRQIDLNGNESKIGYYDFLQVKNQDDFDKLVGFNAKVSRDFGREYVFSFPRGDLSEQNRAAFALRAVGGTYYITLDFKSSIGKQNVVNFPLQGDAQPDAHENITPLPNRLHAYGLFNAKDRTRQSSAPDFISANDSPLHQGRDFRIHVGLGCIECHVKGGLQDLKKDWFRGTINPPLKLQEDDPVRFEQFRRQVFSTFDAQINRDRDEYETAVLETTGKTVAESAKEVSRAFYWYSERKVGKAEIAIELGVSEEDVVRGLKAFELHTGFKQFRVLQGLLKEPEVPLRVTQWEESIDVIAPFITGTRP